jgi:hypothetical protein
VRAGKVVAVVAVLGMVAGFGYWLGNHWERVPLPSLRSGCTVEADSGDQEAGSGDQVDLDIDQMANAATITAVGVRLEMPDRAVVVALATALQESKLRNLPHLGDGNDHDSVGLFQQRPSQGWGDAADIAEPWYAAERFYLALRRVEGWEEMRVTDAAQRVQRSAYPDAYEKWADEADVVAVGLLGQAGGAVTCAVPGDPAARGEAAAEALIGLLARDWGEQAAVAPADPAGLSVSAEDLASGWRYAHWLVAHAAGHGVTRVRFADLEWTADEGGWSATDDPIDHVLAEVAA